MILNPNISKEEIKNFFFSLLSDYSKNTIINIDSAGIISNEIIEYINNIHLHIKTYNFVYDDFPVINTDNVLYLTIDLSVIL